MSTLLFIEGITPLYFDLYQNFVDLDVFRIEGYEISSFSLKDLLSLELDLVIQKTKNRLKKLSELFPRSTSVVLKKSLLTNFFLVIKAKVDDHKRCLQIIQSTFELIPKNGLIIIVNPSSIDEFLSLPDLDISHVGTGERTDILGSLSRDLIKTIDFSKVDMMIAKSSSAELDNILIEDILSMINFRNKKN